MPHMKRFLLALSVVFVLSGCNSFVQHDPLPTVDRRVDLERFMGKWYVLASVPTALDREPYNAVEIYERADRGIRITYTFNSGGFDGELKTLTSSAMVDNPGINTDWEVTYTWPVKGDYKILYLEPDYSVTIVGHPNRKNVWILGRSTSIDPTFYSDLILFLQDLGYHIGKIRRVPHG